MLCIAIKFTKKRLHVYIFVYCELVGQSKTRIFVWQGCAGARQPFNFTNFFQVCSHCALFSFQLLKIWSDSVGLYLGKAKAYINLKEYDCAIAALDQVHKLDEQNAEVNSWRAFMKYEVY